MSKETIFPEGIRVFHKSEKAPDFVGDTLIIEPNKLFKWLKDNPQYLKDYKGEKQLRLQTITGKTGSKYIQVDTYDPANNGNKKQEEEQLPF